MIQSVRFIGSAHAGGGATWSLHGQDGGQSIVLADGTLFVFSDTLLSRDGKQLFLANCAALSGDATLDGAMRGLRYLEDEHGLPREIVPANPLERMAGFRFWPQHGIVRTDGEVLLFYLGIHQYDQKNTWGFRMTGTGLARLDPRTGASERITRGGVWSLWSGDGDLRLGTQVLRVGELVYVFGSRASHAILARVPASAIDDPDAYRFYAGDAWSENIADAVSLAHAAAEFSVSFNEYLGAYLMVYADGFARQLYVRTAPEVFGPWGPAMAVGRLPHRETAEMVALAFEHPSFAKNGGKTVYVSYCQPHFTQNALVAVTFA